MEPTSRPTHPADPGPTHVTVVESDGCHLCHDAQQALASIGRTHPLDVETVDARSARGTDLMQRHRATMSPLVLLEGEFFSHGRLPRHKMVKALEARAAGRRDG